MLNSHPTQQFDRNSASHPQSSAFLTSPFFPSYQLGPSCAPLLYCHSHSTRIPSELLGLGTPSAQDIRNSLCHSGPKINLIIKRDHQEHCLSSQPKRSFDRSFINAANDYQFVAYPFHIRSLAEQTAPRLHSVHFKMASYIQPHRFTPLFFTSCYFTKST